MGASKCVWERACLGTWAVQRDWITRWSRGAQGDGSRLLRGLGHPDKKLGPNLGGVGTLHLRDKQETDLLSFAFWRVILEAGVEKWQEKPRLSLAPGPSV